MAVQSNGKPAGYVTIALWRIFVITHVYALRSERSCTHPNLRNNNGTLHNLILGDNGAMKKRTKTPTNFTAYYP